MTEDEKNLYEFFCKKNNGEEIDCCLDNKSFFELNNLSHMRCNVLGNVALEGKNILEIDAQYGVVTEILSKKAASIDALVFSSSEKKICEERFKNKKKVNVIMLNDIKELSSIKGKYDIAYITNSVLKSISEVQHVLEYIKDNLCQNGKIYFAFDNKYGLKYWNGAKDYNSKKIFAGLEGYQEWNGAKSFSKNAVLKVLQNLDISEYKWFYPYPDHYFTMSIYSDDYLPKKGELSNNKWCFDEDRFVSFDETKVYDSLIDDGMFEFFSNSFLVEIEV